ncbi:S1/P1 nuclease [Geothrix campi]|uniref:S1/P1 nuclease n=1 Tax=Geothrix campi TaxID=2966450 RepID=UPI00214824B3|nr:S1/P1 nuclease [Geothrix sp. SG10]
MKTPLLLLLLAALPLSAWGDKGHRITCALALEGLPSGPRAWYAGREAEVEDHASDPDHWRQDRKEGPRHFLDMEPYGGPDHLPRTVEQAQAQLGGDFYRQGVVPWIIQDRWRDLVDAFRSGDAARVAAATSILSHYVADAHVPLHTTENHDGQATNQRGVHSRWESGLVERYVQREALKALPAEADPHIMESPWDWLRAAHALVPQLLEDDRAADRTTPMGSQGKQRTPAYWMIFWAKQGPVVKGQLQLAGRHLGDAILTAWMAAGRPSVPAKPAH